MRLSPILLRHVTLELVRHALLTTAILVLVTAFGVTVQHYARGQLSAVDTLRFMLYATVPMLAYALPFAGSFAATLAYHRLGQDRELMAAQAQGVSAAALLAPAAGLGLALAVTLSGLNEQVIPRFLHRMAEVVSSQAASLITRSIGKGEAVAAEDFLIYADRAIRPSQPADGVQTQLRLLGAHLIKLKDDGSMDSWGAGATADLWILPPSEGEVRGMRYSEVLYRVQDAVGDAGPLADGRMGVLEGTWTMPGGFGDDPKYLTFGQLRRAYHDPDPLSMIDSRRRDLAFRLAQRLAVNRIVDAMRSGGAAHFQTASDDTLVLRAGGIRWDEQAGAWRLAPRRGPGGSGTVEIEAYRTDPTGARAMDRFLAERATIDASLRGEPGSRGLDLTIDAQAVRSDVATDAQGRQSEGGVRKEMAFGPLTLSEDPVSRCLGMTSVQLFAAVAEQDRRWGEGGDPFLRPAADELRDRIARLRREITSKRHERMAMSASALVMALAGAVVAMRLVHTPPLVAYLWSFFPALATVLLISGGQQLTHDVGVPGLVMLWGGVGGLAIATGVTFVLTTRH